MPSECCLTQSLLVISLLRNQKALVWKARPPAWFALPLEKITPFQQKGRPIQNLSFFKKGEFNTDREYTERAWKPHWTSLSWKTATTEKPTEQKLRSVDNFLNPLVVHSWVRNGCTINKHHIKFDPCCPLDISSSMMTNTSKVKNRLRNGVTGKFPKEVAKPTIQMESCKTNLKSSFLKAANNRANSAHPGHPRK